MKKIFIITFHLFLFFITGCDIETKNLNVTNNSFSNTKYNSVNLASASGKWLVLEYESTTILNLFIAGHQHS